MVVKRNEYLGCFGVLHYGDVDVTVQCVNSLLKLSQIQDCLILILDNDLRKNAKDFFLQKYQSLPNIQVEKTEEKCGFSKANNYIYKFCKKYNMQFIAMLNNDIEIHQKGFINILIGIVNLDKYFLIGPDVYKTSTHEHQSPLALYYPGIESINKNIMPAYREMIINDDIVNRVVKQKKIVEFAHKYLPNFAFVLYRSFCKVDAAPKRYSKSYEDCILSGACLIFTKKFINKEDVAFFPETEFYFEEMIMGLRCKINEYKTLYTPKLKVHHKHAVSSLKDAGFQFEHERTVASRMVAAFEVLKMYEEKCTKHSNIGSK